MRTLADRFWDNVVKIPEHPCWEWAYPGSTNGYGRMHVSDRWYESAHRLLWEMHNGPIPDGMFVCHKCDNKTCVRPDHLFLGTSRDNINDMVQKGHNAKGVKNGNARLTPEAVSSIKSMLAKGVYQRAVARAHGISQPTVSQIARGLTWGWVK